MADTSVADSSMFSTIGINGKSKNKGKGKNKQQKAREDPEKKALVESAQAGKAASVAAQKDLASELAAAEELGWQDWPKDAEEMDSQFEKWHKSTAPDEGQRVAIKVGPASGNCMFSSLMKMNRSWSFRLLRTSQPCLHTMASWLHWNRHRTLAAYAFGCIQAVALRPWTRRSMMMA
jgi:hypothetical protein